MPLGPALPFYGEGEGQLSQANECSNGSKCLVHIPLGGSACFHSYQHRLQLRRDQGPRHGSPHQRSPVTVVLLRPLSSACSWPPLLLQFHPSPQHMNHFPSFPFPLHHIVAHRNSTRGPAGAFHPTGYCGLYFWYRHIVLFYCFLSVPTEKNLELRLLWGFLLLFRLSLAVALWVVRILIMEFRVAWHSW